MFTTYLQRKTALVWAMIFASLIGTVAAQSTYAQTMASVRRAVVSNGKGSKVFVIDTTGQVFTKHSYLLEITRLEDNGSFVARYFPDGPIPASTNVTGSITIAGGIRISFPLTEPAYFGNNEIVFEAAIRISTRYPFAFIGGTFTNTVSSGVPGSGPFPFCARLTTPG